MIIKVISTDICSIVIDINQFSNIKQLIYLNIVIEVFMYEMMN